MPARQANAVHVNSQTVQRQTQKHSQLTLSILPLPRLSVLILSLLLHPPFHSSTMKPTPLPPFHPPLPSHLPQHLPTWGPAQPLTQPVDEPKHCEDAHGGGPGEDHVDGAHQKEADGEEPARADLVRQHPADELADSVGSRLAAGDQAWTHTGERRGPLCTVRKKHPSWPL